MWLHINRRGSVKHFFCLYRSPSFVHSEPLFDQLNTCVESMLQSSPSSEIIIVGDFNVHNTDWLACSSHTDQAGIAAEIFAITNSLSQLVDVSTRMPDRPGDFANTLDLFLTSDPIGYSPVVCLAPLGSSDHCLLSVTQESGAIAMPKPPRRIFWKFSSANWDDLRSFFGSYPWSDLCFSSDVSVSATNIADVILQGMAFYIPHSFSAGRQGSPKWFNPRCAAAVSEKNRLYSLWKSNPSVVNLAGYRCARNACKSALNLAKSQFLGSVASKLIDCPSGSKSFWSLASRISKKNLLSFRASPGQ